MVYTYISIYKNNILNIYGIFFIHEIQEDEIHIFKSMLVFLLI
jgi:hypothetical protein